MGLLRQFWAKVGQIMRHPVMLLLLNQIDMNRLCFLDFFFNI